MFEAKKTSGPNAKRLGHDVAKGRASVVFVCGRRGSGKSVFLQFAAKHWDSTGRKMLVDNLANPTHGKPEFVDIALEVPPKKLQDIDGVSLLQIDEADQWLPQKRPAMRDEFVQYMLRRGRHYDLTIMLATQRPSMLSHDAWALADHVFCFALTAEVDIRTICGLDKRLKPYSESIMTMPPGRCIHWTPHTEQLWGSQKGTGAMSEFLTIPHPKGKVG